MTKMYRDSEGVYHEQEPRSFSWQKWDEEHKAAPSSGPIGAEHTISRVAGAAGRVTIHEIASAPGQHMTGSGGPEGPRVKDAKQGPTVGTIKVGAGKYEAVHKATGQTATHESMAAAKGWLLKTHNAHRSGQLTHSGTDLSKAHASEVAAATKTRSDAAGDKLKELFSKKHGEGYRDADGVHHGSLQFNWADWDAAHKGAGSGAGGRVGKFDTVRLEHAGGTRVNASGKEAPVGAGTLHGRVVDGLGERDKTLHVRDSATDTIHRIPKENVKSVEVTKAMGPGAGLGGRLRTPTAGEVATMGIPRAGR